MAPPAADPEAGTAYDLDTLPTRLETAASHVVTSVPLAGPGDAAGGVRAALGGRSYEAVHDVAVVDGAGALVGLVPLRDLLAADAGTPLVELMDAEPPTVAPGVDQEAAAWAMVRHGEVSLAVVDADGVLVGLIPPRVMLEVLLTEHEEDLDRLGGVLRTTEDARTAAREPVPRRLWHRLPWLLAGLAGAMASALVVRGFETELDATVALAFFLPAVVYLADAVGTQTETLAIRGLAVGVSPGSIVGREALTGLVVGALVAVAFLPVAAAVGGGWDVGLVVALSLLVACSVATVVALVLPWLLHRSGRDPAFGAGPLSTVLQDLLSIAVYLVLARLVLA